MTVSVQPPSSCKVYTPPRLAEAMVRVLLTTGVQDWLEPCCGQGVFLRAVTRCGGTHGNILGIDLDMESARADRLGRVLRGVDFLEWSREEPRLFDCVVGNPPFVSIKTLPEPLRSTAANVPDYDGQAIGLRSNTWYAFLLQSIGMLRNGGSLAFVLPAACEYANYSQCGRLNLTRLFDRVDLIRSRKPMFDGVQEGAAVLVCRRKGGRAHLYRRHEVAELDEVVQCLGALDSIKARVCPNGAAWGKRWNGTPFGCFGCTAWRSHWGRGLFCAVGITASPVRASDVRSSAYRISEPAYQRCNGRSAPLAAPEGGR